LLFKTRGIAPLLTYLGICLAAIIGSGAAYIYLYGVGSLSGSPDCTQTEQIGALQKFASDVVVLGLVSGLGAAALYWLYLHSQVLFGRNDRRIGTVVAAGWIAAMALVRLDLQVAEPCLGTALGEPNNQPMSVISPLGYLTNNLFVVVAVENLILVGLLVLLTWAVRYLLLERRARAWANS